MKRILLSWSSGKDSAWTLHTLRQNSEYENFFERSRTTWQGNKPVSQFGHFALPFMHGIHDVEFA